MFGRRSSEGNASRPASPQPASVGGSPANAAQRRGPDAAAAAPQRAPEPAPVESTVTVAEGDRHWTIEVGPALGDGFRAARDPDGRFHAWMGRP